MATKLTNHTRRATWGDWFPRTRAAWRLFKAALASRAKVMGEALAAAKLRDEADRLVYEANARRDAAELELSSLREVVKERDREIERLRLEKAATESEKQLRILEIGMLNQWIERLRKMTDADIAEEVAREQRALANGAPRAGGPANTPPS